MLVRASGCGLNHLLNLHVLDHALRVIESSCARWNGLHMRPPQALANGAFQGPELSADERNDASTDRLLVDAALYCGAV